MKIVINAGNAILEGNMVDLCASCRYTYEDCPSRCEDVLFGDNNADNVCCCTRYVPVRTRAEIEET